MKRTFRFLSRKAFDGIGLSRASGPVGLLEKFGHPSAVLTSAAAQVVGDDVC